MQRISQRMKGQYCKYTRVHLGRVLDDVADDAQRVRRRVDVRVAHQELLEDVVLDRARQLRLLRTLHRTANRTVHTRTCTKHKTLASTRDSLHALQLDSTHLLFGGHDVHGEDGDHRAVHRHRRRDLRERNALEEQLHEQRRHVRICSKHLT